MKSKLMHIASLLIVFMVVVSLSVVRDRKLLGYEIAPAKEGESFVENLSDGSVMVNTSQLCKDVAGYAGPVPVKITVTDGVIDSVHPLENSETPGFFRRVIESGLLTRWNGMSVDSVQYAEVDGVTGATYSSRALIENVRSGAAYISQHEANPQSAPMDWSVASVAALLVTLTAALVPLKVKNKRYRIVQEVLNVGVLGFWAGTFVNYTLMLNFMSNGIHSFAAITAVIMLITAFIYPLFGRNGYYCAWVCPLGSLQDLAAKGCKRKLHLGSKLTDALTWVRRALWCALMICMWTGVWISWIDYELFSAFVIKSAPVGMLVAGAVVILLSVFVPRPYCRFVCPTGTLLRMSQNVESPNV